MTENKGHLLVWIIIIAIIVVVGMWVSGYSDAKRMVEEEALSILTLNLKVNNMNSIKKSGFCSP